MCILEKFREYHAVLIISIYNLPCRSNALAPFHLPFLIIFPNLFIPFLCQLLVFAISRLPVSQIFNRHTCHPKKPSFNTYTFCPSTLLFFNRLKYFCAACCERSFHRQNTFGPRCCDRAHVNTTASLPFSSSTRSSTREENCCEGTLRVPGMCPPI